ncbi:cell division regulator GpsB [Thalassobacillus sp. CUG 92003]|uniref:cell division regulator GpsB n=1 Tax=Thalassobacillus sp. CUG 92003 TaxID=2736641 RepID=UPI0015E75469|nr:cell division regulator GpsB [Thalassobacillus sp. CUG 92003]
MGENVNLEAREILEKEFKTSMRGYNQEEIDEFLDLIIKDYETFNQEIERLKQENEKLKRSTQKEESRSKPQQAPSQVNYDVLKRLSNLEKEVFGNKYADN